MVLKIVSFLLLLQNISYPWGALDNRSCGDCDFLQTAHNMNKTLVWGLKWMNAVKEWLPFQISLRSFPIATWSSFRNNNSRVSACSLGGAVCCIEAETSNDWYHIVQQTCNLSKCQTEGPWWPPFWQSRKTWKLAYHFHSGKTNYTSSPGKYATQGNHTLC